MFHSFLDESFDNVMITWLWYTRDLSCRIVKYQTWPVWLISVGNIPNVAFLEFSSTVVFWPDSLKPEFNWLSNKNFSIFSSRPVALTRFDKILKINHSRDLFQAIVPIGHVKRFRLKFRRENVNLRWFWTGANLYCFSQQNFKWNPWLLMLFTMILAKEQSNSWLV